MGAKDGAHSAQVFCPILLLEERVDEWRKWIARCRYDEESNKEEDHNHRHKPPSFPLPNELKHLPYCSCFAHEALRQSK